MKNLGSDKPDYTLGISILEQALANLTAQVTQLTTVEVDVVAQSLADLTAVVSATALDIRALDNTDKSHIPLPYDPVTLTYTLASTLNNGLSASRDKSESDWGAGKDFYPMSIILRIEHNAEIFTKEGQGLELFVTEGGGGITAVFEKSYTYQNIGLIYRNTGYYAVRVTDPIIGAAIQSDNTLVIDIYNELDINLSTTSIAILVNGFAV